MGVANLLLVVEDNDVAREGPAVILRREGYRVVPAASGEQALDVIRSGPRPDLILLDMLMPVVDGWSLLKRLAQEGPQPPIPVIVTTGTILTREWATDNGCQGFLHKPFETEALLEEVRRCLGTA